MTDEKETLLVNVNVELTATSLQAIVENAKEITGRDSDGVYRIDTAEKVSHVISRFLLENDFKYLYNHVKNLVKI